MPIAKWMTALRPPRRAALLALLFVLGACETTLLAREPFCALTANITRPDGRSTRHTLFELIDPAGKVVLKDVASESTLRICDFGFGTYSLRIGPNECHPITVSNLRLRLGHPIVITVSKIPCGPEEEHTGCSVYFRVRDDRGRNLPDVRMNSGGREWPETTDEYGRLEAEFGPGRITVLLSKPGYLSTTTSFDCTDGSDTEQELVLPVSPR
jgi:hypothetical protein